MPQDRIADVQLLGVNDFHGNLEPPRLVNGRYEARNSDRTIRMHAGDMVGG